MKRKVIVVMMMLALAGCVYASPEYPVLGWCTGSNVRLRESPSTKSRILGEVSDPQELVLLGERKVNGQVWYHVDDPFDDREAWISGRYVSRNEDSPTPANVAAVKVRSAFGQTSRKTRAIFGRPKDIERTKFFFDPAQREYTREILTYPAFTASFTEGRLTRVEVRKKGYAFGEIEVGETMQIVLDTLGRPASDKRNEFVYEISPVEVLTFKSADDREGVERVKTMLWEVYLDA